MDHAVGFHEYGIVKCTVGGGEGMGAESFLVGACLVDGFQEPAERDGLEKIVGDVEFVASQGVGFVGGDEYYG